jgi:secretion/DNA translocation related TadE-like protein
MRRPADDGVATVVAVGALAGLIVVTAVAVSLGGAVSTRHRLEAAADLAALAAAAHAVQGTEAGCGAARRVTEGMAARLIACRLADWDVEVEVSAGASLPFVAPVAAHAYARAGPVDR